VEAGEEVAGCKVTPVAVPEQVVREASYMAQEFRVLELLPFLPLRTAIVVTEKLKPNARTLFAEAVQRKLGWYGAELLGVEEVARNQAAVAAAYAHTTEAGADLVLFAGASSIDPLDPAYSELERAGGELIRFGMPAHPGSMLWMGRLGRATVLGIASCAGFGKNTSLDLVLPFVFSGSPIDLAGLGHGGLIEKSAGRRFPPYS
jgi:molybdenum cofactor cytidylyltransferase